ncbi:MAG: hypothetical protein AAGL23_16465 [Pseudomonadota bacterium]
MMTKYLGLGLSILALSACGGGGRDDRPDRRVIASPVAFGPISKACLQSDRKKKSRQLCTCIQAAADKTLSRTDQRRSVAFYNDPHLAQQIRTSDRSVDEKFWDAYAEYGKTAERMCG